jgi:hypothetical protein
MRGVGVGEGGNFLSEKLMDRKDLRGGKKKSRRCEGGKIKRDSNKELLAHKWSMA